ncbi:MAG: hypothetical protein AAF969_10265 [Bacteroidota bacterium]
MKESALAVKYNLSPSQIDLFKEYYGATRLPDLCRIFNLSTKEVGALANELGIQKPSIRNDYNLGEENIKLFKSIFPNTPNNKLKTQFGLTTHQLAQLREKYSLAKEVVYAIPKDRREQFIQVYSKSSIDELKVRFRLTRSQVHTLAKKLGLAKKTRTKQPIKKIPQPTKARKPINRPKWVELRNAEILEKRAQTS